MKKLALLIISGSLMLMSCNKDCFEDEYNGTYKGDYTLNENAGNDGLLTFTKQKCTKAKVVILNAEYIIDTVEEGAEGAYTGKTTNDEPVAINFTDNSIQVTIGNSLAFSGLKQ